MMGPGLRKFALIVHLVVSIGWIGAVSAYLVLDLTVATSEDAETLRASYIAMERVANLSIVPLAYATLVTGLVMSFGTKWGLFRHYWVIVSLVMTVFALVVLLSETSTIEAYAAVAANGSSSDDELRTLGSTLLHSIGGLVVLLVITVLNVYKPRGVTRYGWRKQREERETLNPS